MAHTLSPAQQKMRKRMQSTSFFRLFAFFRLPMANVARLRVESLSTEAATTSVPYFYRTKNPFRSTYFACMSMAAELSTGALVLLAIEGRKPSFAMLLVDHQGSFHKKVTERAYFTCQAGPEIFAAVEEAAQTGEPRTIVCKTEGHLKDGTHVASFSYTWSVKPRSKR